ncbi:MAG: sulfatase-like hydrolase/transferase, partial [Candidatus Krumholzibacteria bacterium]|nr:sulfatase-like hydrolase/transferase [Candidatus Krumholzibacteria bacterium]
PALNNRDGFVQGFDDWFYPVGGDTVIHRDPEERLLENTLTRKALTTWQHVDRTDSALVGTFVEWMETAPREGSFVWLHLLSPHKPYTPPPGYAPPRSSGTKRDPNMDSELYNGEIRYSDHLMSKVLEAIDRRVGLDNALVVFTSDHGEEFGDHGMDDHGHSLHREIVHVPLIMSAPNLPARRRVEQTVSLIDLYPTILSLCGMSNLATPDVEGTDMTPLVAGRGPDRVVFAEGMLYGSTERALQVGGFRLMWDEQGDAYRLFRVSADPGETLDVSARFKREIDQLRTSLVDMHKFVLEDFRRRARGESAADSLATARERERVLKAMKSLGYINE